MAKEQSKVNPNRTVWICDKCGARKDHESRNSAPHGWRSAGKFAYCPNCK